MVEQYPDDITLLSFESDETTGVEYIPTGKSPYYLEFRKMLQRLLLATCRSNDLRVYQDGDLTIGVRAGRCVIDGERRNISEIVNSSVSDNETSSVWIDTDGELQMSTSGFPTDLTLYIPLAEVTTESGLITSIVDYRGEAFLVRPSLSMLGISATNSEVNQVLDGVGSTVTPVALDTVTGGQFSVADAYHTHNQVMGIDDVETVFTLTNTSLVAEAGIALQFDMPNVMFDLPAIILNAVTGRLEQRYGDYTRTFVGVMASQYMNEGEVTGSLTGKLVGAVSSTGKVVDVILSIRDNIQSSDSSDCITASVKVNGTVLTTTDPEMSSAEGSGFKSTSQGDGQAAVLKTDGTEDVTVGDILTVDITRTVNGTVSQEADDVVVTIVIAPTEPQ